jgi:tetratricopeptide (TPR) repeat protein
MFSHNAFWDQLAIDSYRAIIKRQPDSVIAHKNLGLAYVRIGRLNKAARSLQRAAKLDSKCAEAQYHLGCVYQSMGKEADAIRAFKKYQKIGGGTGETSIVPDLLHELKSEG